MKITIFSRKMVAVLNKKGFTTWKSPDKTTGKFVGRSGNGKFLKGIPVSVVVPNRKYGVK